MIGGTYINGKWLTTETDGFKLSDAGRHSEGFGPRENRDCTVRATAAVMGIPYKEAHAKLEAMGRKPRRGFSYYIVALKLGLEARPDLSCSTYGKIKKHLESGRFVVRQAGHVFAVIDGKAHDLTPPKDGTRIKMVYELPGIPLSDKQ